MAAYYNEIDPYAAQWLRNLIDAGYIARGDVDERSIVDIKADDLRGYTQAHFFAGIGGWSLALRLAGWPDDRPVWTGSCPCQPFSAAGKGKAADDERHLWPAWLPLIAECRPAIIFGEQVEAAIGWGWIDAVFSDLENEGYACGTTILPACGVGAPHIRNRLWFVADSGRSGTGRDIGDAQRQAQEGDSEGRKDRGELTGRDVSRSATCIMADTADGDGRGGERAAQAGTGANGERRRRLTSGRAPSGVADANGGNASAEGLQRSWEHGQRPEGRNTDELGDAAGGGQREFGNAMEPRRGGHIDGTGNPGGLGESAGGGRPRLGNQSAHIELGQAGPLNGFWSDAEWIACTDGRARPVGPGSFPLGHGIQRRTSKLRAYGNAIVPQVAAEFIRAAR